MSLISYPTIRQYIWYHKKLNTEYFCKVLPILHVKYKYHIYYTDADFKSLKKVNIHFTCEESCEFEKKIYYVSTFTKENHDDIISKLRKIYNIVYIDVDENLVWNERKNEKPKHNFFDKLINFNNCVYNEPSKEFVVGIHTQPIRVVSPVQNMPVPVEIIESSEPSPQIVVELSYKETETSESYGIEKSNNVNTLLRESGYSGNTTIPIVENYYDVESKTNENINIIVTEIINGTGIKKHQEVFDGDDFIVIEANEADL